MVELADHLHDRHVFGLSEPEPPRRSEAASSSCSNVPRSFTAHEPAEQFDRPAGIFELHGFCESVVLVMIPAHPMLVQSCVVPLRHDHSVSASLFRNLSRFRPKIWPLVV